MLLPLTGPPPIKPSVLPVGHALQEALRCGTHPLGPFSVIAIWRLFPELSLGRFSNLSVHAASGSSESDDKWKGRPS